MTYRLGDPVHAAIRCLKGDCGRLLINGKYCGCTWNDPTGNTDPLVGQAVIAVGDDGRIIASGTVTAVDRTGGDLELTVTQHPA